MATSTVSPSGHAGRLTQNLTNVISGLEVQRLTSRNFESSLQKLFGSGSLGISIRRRKRHPRILQRKLAQFLDCWVGARDLRKQYSISLRAAPSGSHDPRGRRSRSSLRPGVACGSRAVDAVTLKAAVAALAHGRRRPPTR
jgi:hypothetical protein